MRQSTHISCSVCLNNFHIQCIPNISATDSLLLPLLPFNHFYDDNDFYNAISDNWNLDDQVILLGLQDKTFNVLDLNHMDKEFPLDDNDPDIHFLRNTNILLF